MYDNLKRRDIIYPAKSLMTLVEIAVSVASMGLK